MQLQPHHLIATATALVLVTGLVHEVSAQNSANASVTAEVQQPIIVTKHADLSFGNVYPSIDATVAVIDPNAAQFQVQGTEGSAIGISFSLPTSLANGPNTLAIGNWQGRYAATNNPAAGTDFIPAASNLVGSVPVGGSLYVFVGATVQPTPTQATGLYSATMTMTVVYF
jgi:predicted dehydrogenase